MDSKNLLARLGAHKCFFPSRPDFQEGARMVYRCKCGKEKKRPLWKRERERSKREEKNATLTHRIARKVDKIREKHVKGWPLMQALNAFARKNPKDVQVVGCDDSLFANSDLFLIDHKVPRAYMGTTVLFVPQCTGEDPISFFLYPNHVDALLKALKRVKKKHTKR